MKNVGDYAGEFVHRARAGQRPSVHVARANIESFLILLAREGFEFSKACLAQISDPELRKIIETIFFSTLAGAAAGATVGGLLAGGPGAQVGAIIGAGAGFVAGCVAVTLTARERDGGLVLSVAQ